jgi:uncharacterized protein YndB with AHSA1/START domain
MQNLHFSITINAPIETVWEKMLGADSYKVWTSAFYPGSYYEGSWDIGSKILFIAPGADGKLSGLVAEVTENKPYEFVAVEYLGLVENSIEVTEGETVKEWIGARESYTFNKVENGTELKIELDVTDNDLQAMQDGWPKALEKLKEICESE